MLSLNFVLFSAIAALVSASPAATANTTAPGEAKQLAPPFEINIEFNSATGNEVAWIAGQSKCNNVVLGPSNTNWCGRRFTLGGLTTLTAEGCGGGLWVYQNGQCYANCGNFGALARRTLDDEGKSARRDKKEMRRNSSMFS
ncbi:hypothetical protein BDV98DRAFT_592260 [Pterulicium gracile]|uniref:Uncharacterized protein n=1 Tax=Pterulicium gracile TaxID=1884261 RepID=A0A5C3QW77_9AGAR|nr:hypothetical protein BDV98DRAFT_592260 [Pterula gracilis]